MSVEHVTKLKKVPSDDDDEEDDSIVPPPDGGWGWMVVFGSFMIHIITDGVTYSFGVFYDEFLTYFNEGKGATAWILSILVGVTLCSGPISSSFVNRWGCRPVTIAGAILGSISMIISVYAQSVTTLYFTIGIATGFGFGLIYLPAIVSVTTYFEKKRSLATGIAVCGSGFGTFIFSPIITRLLEEYGWRGSMLIISGIVLECILFGALFRPLENKKKSNLVINSKTEPVKATTDLHVSDDNIFHMKTFEQNKHGRGHRLSLTLSTQNNKNHHNNQLSVDRPNESVRMALSHPLLPQNGTYDDKLHYGSQGLRKYGPLDKPDVFYQGSVQNIPAYTSHQYLHHMKHSFASLREHPSETEVGGKTLLCGVVPCSEETKHTLKQMLDLSLLKDLIFILFTLSNFLTSIGFNIPYVYIVPKARAMGISRDEAGMLLSVIGIANTIGRIVLGYISDHSWVNRLSIYNWCLATCGIATACSAFCTSFFTLALYGSIFGFTIGAYVGLTSVILVDLLGLDKLTNAFGLLLLFQGIASLVGPPIAGVLYDVTLSYDPGFYLAGITIAISGIMLFSIPCIQQKRAKAKNKIPAL